MHAWVGSEKAKVFLLNDFRYSKDLIPWHDKLLLLEGETVKLPAPKNIYDEDIVILIVVAISTTINSSIKHRGPYNASDDRKQRWWLLDRKTISFAINFSTGAKKSASLPKMFCKISIFLIKSYNIHFYKNIEHATTRYQHAIIIFSE